MPFRSNHQHHGCKMLVIRNMYNYNIFIRIDWSLAGQTNRSGPYVQIHFNHPGGG